MFTATLCLLRDEIEHSEDTIQALEQDIRELDHHHPAIASVRIVQNQYRHLMKTHANAILELRRLAPEPFRREGEAPPSP